MRARAKPQAGSGRGGVCDASVGGRVGEQRQDRAEVVWSLLQGSSWYTRAQSGRMGRRSPGQITPGKSLHVPRCTVGALAAGTGRGSQDAGVQCSARVRGTPGGHKARGVDWRREIVIGVLL
jgi:hypothetical protein